MDVKLFYTNFDAKWYGDDTTCPFVQKCRAMLEDEKELFATMSEFVQSCGDPYDAYNVICDKLFADGIMHMGRLCSLFTFSIVLVKTFPNIRELLIEQLKKQRGAIEELEKWK